MSASKASLFAVGLVALVGAFILGVYVGEGRIPAVEKITQLINKEGDVLSAQVIPEETSNYDFSPFWRVWNTLERKYVPYGTSTAEDVTPEDRVYSSIEGLVASYNDPYTTFMRPQQATEFKIATQGSLEGIGAIIGEQDGGIVVVGPLEGSPAYEAGLVPGDAILAVDGTETAGMSVDDAVKRIRGPRGTEVTLNILSEGDEQPRDVPIVRGTIEIPSTAHSVIERDVAVASADPDSGEEPEEELQSFYLLHLFSFSQSSIKAFERELREYVENGADSLIIDLRGNPGGYIESAIQIASWFLPRNAVVVREYSGPEKRETVHVARGKNLFAADEVPEIAILVDKGSASASEILAGALQEHGVATVIGTNTFGKGSVQELISITDELSLKVTVARWYTPLGVSISEGGLTPDIRIDPTTSTSTDEWIEAAVAALSGQPYEPPVLGGTLQE